MATLPAFLKRNEAPESPEVFTVRVDTPRVERDRYQLRALPHEDVFFYCKRIDNSRLIREADPRAGSACWTVIGAACITVAFLGGILAPNIANTVAGYKLEALRAESQKLADERRSLQLEEAERLNPERLNKLAQGHFVTPSADQVIHLENKNEGKVAMLKH